jgi:RND family efflux transporter MFP subunit
MKRNETGGWRAKRGFPLGRGAAAMLVGGAMLAAACGGGRETARTKGAPPAAAVVAAVQAVPWSRALTVTADAIPFRRATPGTILMGRVDQILRREGDRVRAGDVLAQVESRDVVARLAQAEAGAAAASAMERNAKLTKERMERLLAKQAATQKNLEDATAGYEAAAASLKAAEEGVTAARMYVSYSRVVAPFDGIVAERHVEAGDTVAPGMPLFVVEDTSKMKIEAQVPETAVRGLSVGQPVEIEVDAAAAGTLRTTLSEILPSADPRSRTRAVRALVDNPDGALRPGMSARMRLAGQEGRALALPEMALVRRGPLTGVFVLDGQGVARLRWITVGEARGGRVEVLTGLAEGEQIVTEPPADLEDGRRVEAR